MVDVNSTKRPMRVCAVTALGVASLVVTAGWFTAGREVMYGAFLGIAVFAFLPLIIIAAALILSLVLGIIAALVGGDVDVDGTEAFAEGGVSLLRPYYRFLARRRHPVFWGVPVGVLFGALILAAIVSIVIAPGEVRTAEALAQAQTVVEESYEEHHRYPEPDVQGHLRMPGDGGSSSDDVPLLDGFGRPLRYEVSGAWRVASYTIRSLGYDGELGRDDLCVQGETGLSRALDGARLIAEAVSGDASPGDRLGAARSMRCD